MESTNCFDSSGFEVLAVLMHGHPSCFEWCNLFGGSLTSLHIREWSVSQSALLKLRVMSTLFRVARLVTIRSSWCQWCDLGCLQDTLLHGFMRNHGICLVWWPFLNPTWQSSHGYFMVPLYRKRIVMDKSITLSSFFAFIIKITM